MADFSTPFANIATRRSPTASEANNGMPCGPADKELFDGMFHRLEAELGHLISHAGLTGSDSDFEQVRKAVDALISTAFSASSFVSTADYASNAEALAGTASDKVMSPLRVAEALAALVDSSPGSLDTLNELAAALGDDPNFSTTVLNLLAEAAPVGEIIIFPMVTLPTGFIPLEGGTFSRTSYADLFAFLGTDYGAGDGSTTFEVPDYRGVAVRGWDNGRGLDPSRMLGSYQADELKAHTHDYDRGYSQAGSYQNNERFPLHAHAVTATSSTGGDETRMKNVSARFGIRY